MKQLIKKLGFLLLICLPLISHASTELMVGSTAPNFNLKDQNNKTHKLVDYKDQWLVLYFYPKDYTPGCTTEACLFRDDILKIRALNAKVIGVSLDDSESHEEFAKKYNLPFPLLADTEGEVSEAYDALLNLALIKFAKRHTFIIGPDGLIKKIYREVEPKEHSKQIITDLKMLISK